MLGIYQRWQWCGLWGVEEVRVFIDFNLWCAYIHWTIRNLVLFRINAKYIPYYVSTAWNISELKEATDITKIKYKMAWLEAILTRNGNNPLEHYHHFHLKNHCTTGYWGMFGVLLKWNFILSRLKEWQHSKALKMTQFISTIQVRNNCTRQLPDWKSKRWLVTDHVKLSESEAVTTTNYV
jgi:hypothetical protein